MCDVIRLPNGGTAIVCGRGHRHRLKACATCGRFAALLCDQKIAGGKTCDAPMCSEHAKEIGPDRHLCPRHAHLAAAQLSMLPP